MTIQDRRRDHEEPHVRTVEQQILDALLRIEELLSNPLVVVKADTIAKPEETKAAPKGVLGRGRK